jgi:hypothetical protein
MNRQLFVSSKKLVRTSFSVHKVLKMGSTWRPADSNPKSVVRVKRFCGIEKGKYVFAIESCGYARWYKGNDWREGTWAVDEVYMQHDFPKRYKKIMFFEPLNFGGATTNDTLRSIALAGVGICLISAVSWALGKHWYMCGIMSGLTVFNFISYMKQRKRSE